MVKEGNLGIYGRGNSGLHFTHEDSVVMSTNLPNTFKSLKGSVNFDTSLAHIRMSNQPWPTELKTDPLRLLPEHEDSDTELSALTIPRDPEKTKTLELTAPVILLNSLYSDAQRLTTNLLHDNQGIVYGETLVELLRWILETIRDHTHPPSSPPTYPVKTFADRTAGDLATHYKYLDYIGHPYNILNYFVRSK